MSISTVRAKNVTTQIYEPVDLTNVFVMIPEYQKGFTLLKCQGNEFLFPVTNEGIYDIIDRYEFFYKAQTSPTTYINLGLIKKYNSDLFTVYFDDVNDLKEAEEVVSQKFAEKKLPEIKKALSIENDLAYEVRETSRNAKNKVSYKKASILRGLL